METNQNHSKRLGYRECIVTFFDVLGFSELLHTREPHEIAEILSIFRAVSGHAKPSMSDQVTQSDTPADRRIEIVSDAIVRIRENKICSLSNTSELFDELIILKEIQLECLSRGILVRGAMTIGPMYFDNDLSGPVFGPALVEAYNLESREVIYPRIAISEDIIMMGKGSSDPARAKAHEGDLNMISLMLSRDGSGLYYIDYLRVLFDHRHSPASEAVPFLQLHKELIQAGLAHHHGSVRRKYLWLRHYHDTAIDQVLSQNYPFLSVSEFEEISLNDWKVLKVGAE